MEDLQNKVAELTKENEVVTAEMQSLQKSIKDITDEANAKIGQLQQLVNQKLTRIVEIQGAVKTLSGLIESSDTPTPVIPK